MLMHLNDIQYFPYRIPIWFSNCFLVKFLIIKNSSGSSTTPLATRKISDESQYPSGRSRYAALKDRKSRVARSKSSAVLGMEPEDDDEEGNDDANEPTPFTSRYK